MNSESVTVHVGKDSVTLEVGDWVMCPDGKVGEITSFDGMIAKIDNRSGGIPVCDLQMQAHRVLDNLILLAYSHERRALVLRAEIKLRKAATKRADVRRTRLFKQGLCPAAVAAQMKVEFPELY